MENEQKEIRIKQSATREWSSQNQLQNFSCLRREMISHKHHPLSFYFRHFPAAFPPSFPLSRRTIAWAAKRTKSKFRSRVTANFRACVGAFRVWFFPPPYSGGPSLRFPSEVFTCFLFLPYRAVSRPYPGYFCPPESLHHLLPFSVSF